MKNRKEGTLNVVMAPDTQTASHQGLAGLTRSVHSLKERVDMIERSKWADEFSYEQMKTLAAYLDSYLVEQGTMILHEGGHDAHMILIIQGQVNIVKEDAERVQKVIATLGPGRTFGEMSLIDGEPRSASAVAATPVALLVLTKDSFIRLTQKAPHLALSLGLKIAKLVSQRLRQTIGRLIDYI